MIVKPENLKRALAILTTEPDAAEVQCYGNMISVKGVHLLRYDEDDSEVLSVLMADKEFGFAAGHRNDCKADKAVISGGVCSSRIKSL